MNLMNSVYGAMAKAKEILDDDIMNQNNPSLLKGMYTVVIHLKNAINGETT